MARETAEQINAAASLWAVRHEQGLSPEDTIAFEAWLAGDSRRLGAFGRMAATLRRTERAAALGRGFDPQAGQMRTRTASRRGVLIGGGAIAASLAAAGVFVAISRPRAFETRKGEKRVVGLDDGSVITLNTATRLDVHYSPGERLIRLSSGEALFDVAKDAERPFIVRAGDTDVRAVGTSFTVARLADAPVQVLVREGIVDVSHPQSPQAKVTRLPANTRAVVAMESLSVEVAAVDAAGISRDLAWREGRVVIEGEALSDAAARFERYSDTRIVIDDPILAAEPVSGVFEANDPITFAQSMALSLNGRAEVSAGQVRITR
jgi:transmembrane sensor